MNNIDIANIKKELAKRKAANYEWKDGGEMTKDDVMLRTTKELNELLKEYENDKKNRISDKVHELVDEIFEKYSDADDNMIPLSCAYRPEYRLYGDEGMEIYESISFTDVDGGYNDNPHVKPIARNWFGEDKRWEKYAEDLGKLVNEIVKTKVPFAEDFWKDDGERLNEYWYGVIAITHDYKIVGFEIRNDGLPQDSNKLNYPNIMTV
jgi:hypothetical protein